MPILTKVEAKGWRGRLFLTLVTLALVVGGMTMLYPFLIMLAGAMRSDMDAADMGMLPRYLHDDAELVRKFLETKYEYNPSTMNVFRQSTEYSFRGMPVDLEYSPQAVADAEEFLSRPDMPRHWVVLGGAQMEQHIACRNNELLVADLRERFDNDLDALEMELGTPIPSWWLASVRPVNWANFRAPEPEGPLFDSFFNVQRVSPPAEIAPMNLSGWFIQRLAIPTFGLANFEACREAFGLDVDAYEDIVLPERVPPPEQAGFREAWIDYIFDRNLHVSFVRSDTTDAEYQQFLRERFGTIDNLRTSWPGSEAEAFEDIRLPADHDWLPGSRVDAYSAFLQTVPLESLRLVGPEFAWREFLQDRYETVAEAARAHGVSAETWDEFRIPLAQVESAYVLGQTRVLRWRYALRNFRIVVRQMFVQGRPFFNTIVYVLLCLAFALTMQPLAAYSLSRFGPPGTWKIIFVLVATMAFPPMVAMIPQFMVIRTLGLLNTFIALVLPQLVNGMLIFLLKGFFDSIPKDLYDAAVIDGASEWRIFWQITMSMSKPILAVVALQTFSSAWMAFLYPLIVCPDERMHVLAVWLQQFQLSAPGTAVFAAIIVASVPSMLIFIFAQKTIMRGIAVPSEK